MRKGFTLIELIIVMTIIGIITGAAGFILLTTVDAWTFKLKRNDLVCDARLAVKRMTREIRAIKDTSSVITAASSQIRFINTDDVDITYSLTGTDLNRTEDVSSNLLAENVSGLTFTYYDSSGSTISSPQVSPSQTDMRRVRINLTLTKDGENVYFQSEAVPRNF